MDYKASLDSGSKIITALVTVLFLGIITCNFWLLYLESGNLTHFGATIFTTTLLVAIYLFCYLFGPTKYIVDQQKITIKRPLKDKTIDMKEIKEVFLTEKESMKWIMRTFGNGGLFGYYGKFRNGTSGNMTWYATKRNNYLIIETHDHQKIVLTPDDIKMMDEIRKNAGLNA